ncbi:MAG: hypothetical protein QM589_19155 [Thermomicrobiales bacterium]
MEEGIPVIDSTDPRVRFGLYLRPSYAMARAVAEMHELMRRQFGQTRAGKYMPHATIGFFQSALPWQDLAAAVTPALARHAPFVVQNHGPVAMGRSVVLDIHHDDAGGVNAALQALHDDAHAALAPLIADDLEDRFRWPAEKFQAHITLAQTIRPDWLRDDEVMAFVREAEPVGPRRFMAEYVHLYAVLSDDWDSVDWSDSLTWDLLASWRLG